MNTRIKALTTALTTLALAGCAGGTGATNDPYTGYDNVYQLKDGRQVTCIAYLHGLSCDWTHTDNRKGETE